MIFSAGIIQHKPGRLILAIIQNSNSIIVLYNTKKLKSGNTLMLHGFQLAERPPVRLRNKNRKQLLIVISLVSDS